MRLVASSNPGDVDRDAAVRLLAERAVLTRSICRELAESEGRFSSRRPQAALAMLLQWVWQHHSESIRAEPHASDGLDKTVVPEGLEALFEEIKDGAEVAEALFMLTTADTTAQFAGDEERIRKRLDGYWTKHSATVGAPSPIEIWLQSRPSGSQ